MTNRNCSCINGAVVEVGIEKGAATWLLFLLGDRRLSTGFDVGFTRVVVVGGSKVDEGILLVIDIVIEELAGRDM